MFLHKMYEAWLNDYSRSYDKKEQELILTYALKTNSGGLAETVINKHKYNMSDADLTWLEQFLKADGSNLALLLLYKTFYENKQELAVPFVSGLSVEFSKFLLSNARLTFSTPILKEFWKKNNAELRLLVLKSINWLTHDLPIVSWCNWFVQHYGSYSKNGFAAAVWESAVRNDNLHKCLWEAALKSKDILALSGIYPYYTKAHTHQQSVLTKEYQTALEDSFDDFIFKDDFYIAWNFLGKAFMQLLEYLPASNRTADESVYSLGVKILTRAEKALSEDSFSYIFAPVQKLLSLDIDSPEIVYTKKDLLAAVKAGKMPGPALAVLHGKCSLDDELYLAVLKSPNLPVSPLLTDIVTNDPEHNVLLNILLESKSHDWMVRFACQLWISQGVYAFKEFYRKLTVDDQDKVLDYLLENPSNICKLQAAKLITAHKLASSVKFAVLVQNADNSTWLMLKSITKQYLKNDSASWELFESLSANFTGTYKELLEAVVLCAKESN